MRKTVNTINLGSIKMEIDLLIEIDTKMKSLLTKTIAYTIAIILHIELVIPSKS